jgi:valyl-tRNA synthetase
MADLQQQGLVERIEDRAIEIDHSDRSKSIVEPWLSKQWFVRMADVPGGVVMGRGTDEGVPRGRASRRRRSTRRPARCRRCADGAAARGWFHPDPERYRKMYDQWLAEKRDWCISRQLWWGHRIPVWRGSMSGRRCWRGVDARRWLQREDVCAWVLLRRRPPLAAGGGVRRS